MARPPDPRRVPALGAPGRQLGSGHGAVSLVAGGFESVINLRGDPDAALVVDAVKNVCGHELPLTPNRWTGTRERAALWLGPDEWLLLAPDGEAAGLEAALWAACPDDPRLGVVDLSHNYAGFVLAGEDAPALLARGCSLDLHPAVVPVNYCAQTLIAKAPALLRFLDAEPTIEIRVRNSYARYLAAWFEDAISLMGD